MKRIGSGELKLKIGAATLDTSTVDTAPRDFAEQPERPEPAALEPEQPGPQRCHLNAICSQSICGGDINQLSLGGPTNPITHHSKDRDAVIEALNLELTSLQNTILTQVTEDDHDFATAIKTATPGRLLLDIKRSGKYKCRGVKQGFKEDKELSDGPDFIYYSNVVKLNAVRAAGAKTKVTSRARSSAHARGQAHTRDYTRDDSAGPRVTTNAEATIQVKN